MQSSPGLFPSSAGQGGTNLEAGEQAGVTYAGRKSVGSLAELRALSSEQLGQVQGRFSPITDGWFIPENTTFESIMPVMAGFQRKRSFDDGIGETCRIYSRCRI